MKHELFSLLIIAAAGLSLAGCKKESDVTSSPKYGFASFAGTVWKTKVKLGIADSEKGEKHLLAPMHYDPTHPSYTSSPALRVTAVVSIGARVRIAQLMKDNGAWGGVRVTAILEDGTRVYLDEELLSDNAFISPGHSAPRTWGVNPDMFETVSAPSTAPAR